MLSKVGYTRAGTQVSEFDARRLRVGYGACVDPNPTVRRRLSILEEFCALSVSERTREVWDRFAGRLRAEGVSEGELLSWLGEREEGEDVSR